MEMKVLVMHKHLAPGMLKLLVTLMTVITMVAWGKVLALGLVAEIATYGIVMYILVRMHLHLLIVELVLGTLVLLQAVLVV